MKGYRNWGGSIALLCCAVILGGGIDRRSEDALKVVRLLNTIETHSAASGRGDRSAEVSEKELNAYIAYRLAQDKQAMVNSLRLNLLGNNHVHGKLRLDVQHLNLGPLFGDDLDFDFQGNVLSRHGAGRLDLTTLFLNGYAVGPKVLDFVLAAAAKYYRRDIGGVDDWYALPKGIKRITLKKAKAVLYY